MSNANEGGGGIIRVRDAAEVLEFRGELIFEVSTENPNVARWTEMQLFRFTDGTDRFLLHIIGRSVVVHANKGSCNSGVPVQASKLPNDVELCSVCKPIDPDEVEDDFLFDMEEDRYTSHICDSAEEVITKLRSPRQVGPRVAGSISGPGQRLLAGAAQVDSRIMAAMSSVRKL